MCPPFILFGLDKPGSSTSDAGTGIFETVWCLDLRWRVCATRGDYSVRIAGQSVCGSESQRQRFRYEKGEDIFLRCKDTAKEKCRIVDQ